MTNYNPLISINETIYTEGCQSINWVTFLQQVDDDEFQTNYFQQDGTGIFI